MKTASMMLALLLGVAACAPQTPPQGSGPAVNNLNEPSIYRARVDTGPNGEPIELPAVRPAYLTNRNVRQQVPYNGPEGPGTIVVDPYARVLYHVEAGGMATRYGIAVGKAGTGFDGEASIRRKAAWPSWTPTANMVATQPELYGHLKGGLPGGKTNPLGARALYLYQGSVDTMYRIHGTMDPSSIGKATSAGCIRLFNQDILDLFEKTTIGTQVKVRSPSESLALEGPQVPTPDGYLVPAALAQQEGSAAQAQEQLGAEGLANASVR